MLHDILAVFSFQISTQYMLQILVVGMAVLLVGCTTVTNSRAEPTRTVQHGDAPKQPSAHEESDDLLFNIVAAEISAHMGDHDAAFAYYQRASAQSDHPDIAERGARLSIHSKNVKQTITATRRWVELEPDSMDAHRVLGALYLRDSQKELAVAQFTELLRLNEKNRLVGFRLIAEQLRKEPNSIIADAVLEDLVAAQANSAEAWYIKGWYLSKRQKFKLALSAVERALKVNPQFAEAKVLRVTILEALGRNREVAKYLKQQVAASPGNAALRVQYGEALLKQKRERAAIEQFEHALEITPRSAQILSAVALIHLNRARFDKARPYLNRLLELPGQQDKANFYLGELERGKKNMPEAMSYYASVGKGTLYLAARVEMANLMAEEDVDAGLSILRGLSFTDERRRLQVQLIEAGMLEQADRHAEAVKIYSHALKISPDNEDILYSRAMAADLAGDLQMLERDLHAIVKKNPGHYHAWNALGYTLTLRTDRYAEAKGYLEKALALRPKDFYVLDSMGWVLYKMGQLDQALDYLERAFKAKADAEVAAHLGEVRWVKGDRKGAKEAWAEGKRLDRKNKILLETLKRFGQ